MTRARTDYELLEQSSLRNRRRLRQEEFILDVTEALAHALARDQVTKKALADRLGKSKGFVSQILAGGRNLTLRTVADVADALGYRPVVRLSKPTAMGDSVTHASFGLREARLVGSAFAGGRRLVAVSDTLGAFAGRKYAKGSPRRRPRRKSHRHK